MPKKKRLAILPGDGVGPEIMEQSIQLLKALQESCGLIFEFEECPVGGSAIKAFGTPLPEKTLATCQSADAVLLGTIGAPGYEKNPPELQPDHALVELRTGLNAYCGFRGVRLNNVSPPDSPLNSTTVKNIDFVVIRDLQDGLYFNEYADDAVEDKMKLAAYTEQNIKRVARKTFQLARIRKRKVTAIDNAHEDAASRWWRAIVRETVAEFPLVNIEHMSLEDCLQNLDNNPFRFDVLLAEPGYGKAVNDFSLRLTSSAGMLASACLGDGASIYQPAHRAKTEIAGKNIASPIAMMHSVAMMLQYSFNLPLAAGNIEEAISTVEVRGDVSQTGTRELGRIILEEVMHQFASQPFMTV